MGQSFELKNYVFTVFKILETKKKMMSLCFPRLN